MKAKIILIAICALLSAIVSAETISVNVKDSKTKQAIEYATVELLNEKDSVITGGITDSTGYINLQGMVNNCKIRIQFLGYKTYEAAVTSKDLGIVYLEEDAKELAGVTVTGKTPLVVRKVDRLVFNVENSIAATGGDATDALKVTPNVRITEDNVSIVGKGGLLVLVDDREIHLSGSDLINYLKSIPSDNIKSIEVITTPPAKYEAQGNSGILNIILKKAKNDSWSLQLRTSATKAYDWTFSEGATFMLQKNKWSVMAGISGQPYSTFLYTNDIRYRYPAEYWKSAIFNFNKNKGLGGNLNVGYKVTDNLKVGIYYNGRGGNGTTATPVDRNYTKIFENSAMQTLNKMYTMDGMTDFSNYNHSLNFNAVQKLDTLGKKISLDVDYFITANDKQNPFYQNNFYYNPQQPEKQYFTQNNSNLKITNISSRLDFEMPYQWATLNYGGKISFTKNNSNTFGDFYQIINNQNIEYLTQNNNFLYKENNQALYVSAQKDFDKRWSAKAGLRFEATQTEGSSTPKGNKPQTNKTHYEKLFPTAYLSYKLNDNNTFSTSYSRRIERPGYWALDPARWYQTLNDIVYGNPFIQPSFINSVSLSHQFKSILTSEISYYVSNGDITQIIRHKNDTIYFQHDNWANSKGFSISETLNLQITKWWTTASGVSTSFSRTNVYKSLVDEGLYNPKYNNWEGIYFYSNNSFNLNKAKTLTLQTNIWGMTRAEYGEGYMDPVWNLDMGLKYAFLNNKLQLSLYASDIFYSGDRTFHSLLSGIKQSFHQTYDSQYLRLTVSYKFGNDKISVQSREGSNTEEKRRAGN